MTSRSRFFRHLTCALGLLCALGSLRPACAAAAAEAAEHPLHLLRRPRLPGDQRLRRPAQAARDAEHGSPREGRHALRSLPGDELDLRPEPRDDPDGQVLPPERLLQQLEPQVRRHPDDLPKLLQKAGYQTADRRQVAPHDRSRRASTTGTSFPARASTTTRR